MSDDTPQERQDNEIEALKAIFGDELKDLCSTQPCQVWCPLDILLTLFPQQGSMGNQEIHCTIDLHIKCPHKYPDVEPVLEIKQSKGLSDIQVMELLEQLNNLASRLKGEVMILELAQHVQTYLHNYNKPGFKSFYDEMLVRQQQTEQLKLRDKQVKEDKERQEIKGEILRRQEILRSEMKLRREPRLSLTQDGENVLNMGAMTLNPITERTRTNSIRRHCQSTTSESSDSSYCEHRGTKVLRFSFKGDRQVNRGRCLGHSERGCVVYAGLDSTTGELLAISEWMIKLNTSGQNPPSPRIHKRKEDSPVKVPMAHYDLASCMKQIEQEMSFLMKLHHVNLVHYVNMKYANEDDTLVVYLLQEFVLGGNISCLYLNDHVNMEVDMLRHFASGLLEAIDFLHRNNVVHKDLRETSVFIDRTGTVRVADYSLDKRLMELCQGGSQGGRYSKKQDVFRIGILLLSLLRGCLVPESDPQVPSSLSQDLKDFLSKCLDVNERTRWSAEQLLKHQFIKTPIERPSPQRSVDVNSGTGSDDVHGDSPEAMDIQLFIPTGANGQSRIKNEFEILKWLGKGAFGDVLKVKNKLDGGCYAIKRIELNPKNKLLNKKITREVKLLSRLNHENVVRYYNSWIESATLDQKRDQDASSSSSPGTGTQPSSEKQQPHVLRPIETIDKNQDVEEFAPPAHSMEWSVSYSSKSKQLNQTLEEESSSGVDTSESEDDDEDLITYLRDMKNSSSSDSIEFKQDDDFSESRNDCSSSVASPNRIRGNKIQSSTEENNISVLAYDGVSTQFQYLYIQMEFCEKSTLRNAIDTGLHMDSDRMWRLFREIVEGLSHIHQQGMIHRDLKPVNIFLDSNDHVKIGDFGLATNILPRPTQSVLELKSPQEMDSYSQDVGDGSLTGQVGTALYVAPELMMTGNKAIYNQKVDIYSLGIILFEMSYMPLKTGMERVKTLGNLRLKDIVFPENFDTQENSKQVYLIRWLLNHDASSRPTCMEILQWDLPGLIEEYELKEVLRHALMNTDSKAYKHLISACFQQELTPAEDITYDMNLSKVAPHYRQPLLLSTLVKELIVMDGMIIHILKCELPEVRLFTCTLKCILVVDLIHKVIKIFKLHGGVELSPPLLLPRCRLYDQVESSVRLMTHSGGVVHIPHDLRVPFARYVVWNGITMLKRYSIEKVYREKKIFGFHPRELYECSFDIVTPTPGNLFSEAELLSIVCEIANEFPAMKTKNLTIRLNHTSLLKAVLMNCDVEPEKYNDIYTIFSDARDGKLSKFQIQTHLISLCLSDHAMVGLFSLMETECSVDKLGYVLKSFLKRKGEASVLAREGIRDLEAIVYNAEVLGVKYPIVISPCMVYNINQYSGMMCQFVCELKKKRRKTAFDVIAAGGRYDSMLNDLRKKVQHVSLGDRNDVSLQSACGISLSLERLVQGAVGGVDYSDVLKVPDSDVCVYATSSTKQASKEKAQIINMLWSAGVRASLLEATNADDVQEACRELNVTHVVIVSDSEQGTVRVRSWDRERFQESKVAVNEIVEFIQRLVKTWNDDSSENTWSGVSSSAVTVTKTESRSNFSEYDKQSSSYNAPLVNFVTPEKLAANTRKRFEMQILAQMSSTLQRFSAKTRVDILALSVDSSVLRTLALYLETDVSQEIHDKAVRNIIERHQRHKKYLEKVCDEFRDSAMDKSKPVVALYSLPDSIFKMII